VLLVASLVLLAVGASGERHVAVIQGATAADAAATGLAAYGEGRYEDALMYLTPVVVSDPSASAEADLVLAEMYEHGLGVAQNLRRAYALYALAAGASGSFPIQSLARASLFRLQQLGADPEVIAILSYGFQDGLVLQTMPLDGGGVLEVTRAGLAVYRAGERGETPWALWMGTVEGLWLQSASRDDGRSRQAVEVLFWASSPGGRTLMWRVYDVRGSAPAHACEEPLLDVHGFLVNLPAWLPADLRARARLRLDARGRFVCEPPPDDLTEGALVHQETRRPD
jgi:hypothetical protein